MTPASEAQTGATSILRCPDCREHPRQLPLGPGAGIARCACREYPMAEGVLVTEPGALHERLLEALRVGDMRRAKRLLIGSHARKAVLLEAMGVRQTFERFVRHRALSELVHRFNLAPALHKLSPRALFGRVAAAAQWNTYIRHRFVQPQMMSILPLLGLVRGREGPVMDAPCGMGHLAFLLGKLVPPERLVCMDLSGAFVYSTRRFFMPRLGAGVVHNMNRPLPLADASLAAAFCLDAFHYVENRPQLAREFMRVVRDDGVVVIAHLHNRLHRTDYAGYPLSPSEYLQLFDGHTVRLVPEEALLEAYVTNRPVDLSQPVPEQELNRHKYLHLVAAKSEAALGRVGPVRDALIDAARNPRVSGLYRMRHGENGTLVFERDVPEGLLEHHERLADVLPARHTMPASAYRAVNGRPRFDNERELLERHILVDVPEDY